MSESLRCTALTNRFLRCNNYGWFRWGGSQYCGMHLPEEATREQIEAARRARREGNQLIQNQRQEIVKPTFPGATDAYLKQTAEYLLKHAHSNSQLIHPDPTLIYQTIKQVFDKGFQEGHLVGKRRGLKLAQEACSGLEAVL